MSILTFIAWLFAFVPLAIVYGAVGAFLGYLMHTDRRDSGKWWADLPSTLGIIAGIAFAYALTG
jgi:uncharacterized membrane protein HdeD (DUF308 family)